MVTLAILKVLEVGIFEHFAQVGEILNVVNEEICRDMQASFDLHWLVILFKLNLLDYLGHDSLYGSFSERCEVVLCL